MGSKESLQNLEYRLLGPMHRRAIENPHHPWAIRYRKALEWLPETLDGERVLDMGGAEGALASKMADRGASVTVTDLFEPILRSGARTDKRIVPVQNRTILPFSNQTFQHIILLETLEHIPDDSEMTALREAHRVLCSDGTFIMSVPADNLPLRPKHYRHYSSADLRSKLHDAGFLLQDMYSYKYLLSGGYQIPFFGTTLLTVYGSRPPWLNHANIKPLSFFACDEGEAEGFIVLAKKV